MSNNLIQSAISAIRNKASEMFNDNQGFVQQGKFTAQPIQKAVSNLGYQARDKYYQTLQNAWSPGGTNYGAVNAIQTGIKNVANAPRWELPKPQVQNQIGQTAINLAYGIPESIINIPRNYGVGIARTGLELGTAYKEGRPVNIQNLAGGVAPLAESLVDIGTMGFAKPAISAVKEGAKLGIKQAIKKEALKGAGLGALGGLTYGTDIQYGKQFDAGELVKNIAGGALIGGVAGGALGGAGAVKTKIFESYKNLGFDDKVANDLTKKQFIRSENIPIKLKQPKAQVEFNAKINSVLGRPLNTPVFSDDLKAYNNKINGIPNTELGIGMTTKKISRDKVLTPSVTGEVGMPKVDPFAGASKEVKAYIDEASKYKTATEFQKAWYAKKFERPKELRDIGPADFFNRVKYIQEPYVPKGIFTEVGKNQYQYSDTNPTQRLKIKPKVSPVVQQSLDKVADVNQAQLKSNQVLQENLPTMVKTSPDLQQPMIKQPAQVDLQSGQVLKPNKLDSTSEQIIQQARGQIGKPVEAKKTLSQKFDDFYTNWVDRYNPLVKLTEGVKNIDPSKDPKYIIRKFLGAGSIAEQRFNTEMKPILKTIDDLKIDKLDLDTYLINKRNVGFGEIGRKVKGSDPIQSQKVVSALEAKYGDSIKGVTDQLYNFQNQGLDDMVKAGFISPESANAMRGQNPNYAPFQRIMDELDDYIGLPTKKAMQGTQPIKKLKGSEKQILSPVESIIANIFSQRAAIEKNNVAKSVAGLQELIPNLGFKKVSKGGDSTITVWNNGKKEFIEVGNDIARAMKGMNEESVSSFMKILTAPANLLRQGATGRNPEFMIPNIIRDQLDAATNSKYGYVPFVDYIRGLYHVAKKDITGADEVLDAWMKSGGAQSFSSISGRKSISEMFDKTKAKKGLFSWLGTGLDIAGKYSETPTRVGLFGKAIKKGATALEAGYESREGTMDFARMGAKMKVANSIIPFLNVQVQGFDKMIRNFKNAPAQTTLKMGIYGVAPAVLATLYNEAFHPDEYAEIPQYVKDDNFVLTKGKNERGTVDYVAIPKGNLIRLATNPAEHFVSYLAGNDKTTFGEMVTQLLSSNLPLLGEGSSPQEVAIKTIGQNIPQAIKPITENLMNKSFYKYDTKKEQSKEIVPYYLQNKAPAEQTYKFTPAMYQAIGRFTNSSPLKVQNLMEGYLAGYTKIPANIIDSLKNISEGKEVEQNKIPILRRFIQETYPTSNTVAKPKAEATPLIPQAQATEGGFLDKIFPGRVKKPEDLSTVAEIKYTNDSGNEATLKLTKFDEIAKLPTSNKYQMAIKESKQYSTAATILDNTNLSPEQQQIVLKRLGVDPDKAEYYRVANDNTNLKTMYVMDALARAESNGINTLELLKGQRQQVNGQMIASNAVLDNLVDEGIISKSQATQLKKYKMEGGKLTPIKKSTGSKKIKIKAPKKIKVSKLKATKIKKPKSLKLKFKKSKPIKLKLAKRK